MPEKGQIFLIKTNGSSAQVYKAKNIGEQGNGRVYVEFDDQVVHEFTDEWEGIRREQVSESGTVLLPNGALLNLGD